MKRSYILLLFLLFRITVQAQCPQRYLDKVFTNVNTRQNIIYGGNRLNIEGTRTWLAFNLYEPKEDTVSMRPLVFLLHGGGFTNWPPLVRTSPDIVELATDLARRGYVVVSPEYRLYSGENTSEKILQTAMAAAIDVNDAVCYVAQSIGQGNPYRIDTSRFILGGVSAGGFLALNFGLFLDDTAKLDQYYRDILNSVATFDNRNPQEILTNKFCGVNPLGIIAVSSALLDTGIIQYKNAGVLLIHGTADHAIPYGIGNMYSDPSLPKIFGSGAIFDKIKQTGMHVELDTYPGLWHVPFLWDFGGDISAAIQNTLTTGSIFNKPVLDSTEKHIARFCYGVIGNPSTDCNLTGFSNHILSNQLSILPNPSSGIFDVVLPKELGSQKIDVQVQNLLGQIMYNKDHYNSSAISVDLSGQQKGVYLLKIGTKDKEIPNVYVDKIILQ